MGGPGLLVTVGGWLRPSARIYRRPESVPLASYSHLTPDRRLVSALTQLGQVVVRPESPIIWVHAEDLAAASHHQGGLAVDLEPAGPAAVGGAGRHDVDVKTVWAG